MKLLGDDFIEEDYEAEQAALEEQERLAALAPTPVGPKDKGNPAAIFPKDLENQGAGDDYYDNEDYGGEYDDEYGQEDAGAKSNKSKKPLKKKKTTLKKVDDSAEKPALKKGLTKKDTTVTKKKKQPTQKK
jgi:hypothetical protein